MAVSLTDLYEKIKCIHAGNASNIWTVSDNITGNIYVLKEIHRTGLPYKQLQKIDSKIIPKVIAVKEEEGITYVVEEFIQGKTLQEYINNKGPFSDDELIEIGIKLCEGLNLLHQQNIIHRDIKPSNIMLTNDGNVKLIDFDASRVYKHGNTQDTCFIGTIPYAPSELLNEGQTCQQSDIFSLGATFRALLPNGYNGKLTAIIDKCTMHDMRKRYSNVKKLQSDLIGKRKHSFSFKKLLIGLIFICGAGIAVATSGPTIFTALDSEQTQQVEEKNDTDTHNTAASSKEEKSKSVYKYKNYFDEESGYSFDYPEININIKKNEISDNISWGVQYEGIIIENLNMADASRVNLPTDGSFTTEEMLNAYKSKKATDTLYTDGFSVQDAKIIGDHAVEVTFKKAESSTEKYVVRRTYIGKPGRKDMPNYSPSPNFPSICVRRLELRYQNRLSSTGKAVWDSISNSFKPGLLLD